MDESERALGHIFGIIGAALLWVGGLVAAATGIAREFLGQPFRLELAALSEATLLLVVGALVFLFTHLGFHAGKDRLLTSGICLVVLAVVGWGVLGLGSNVLALLGGLFALLAGVMYLIEPTRHAAQTATSTV
jgi:hypothetical protein